MKAPYLFALIAAFALSSCRTAKLVPFVQTPLAEAPDYSKKSSWAALPSAYPAELTAVIGPNEDKAADVFFVYPTLFSDPKDPRYNADLSDADIRAQVVRLSVSNQASAFAAAANIYVPFYRQSHIRVFDTELRDLIGDSWEIAYQDVKRAFEYYLAHYNQGRPIIIAGHSQGSMHASRLVSEFFDGKPLSEQLIAAYLPGAGIKPDFFSELKLLEQPESIGGFVSWNTYKKGALPKERYENYYKGSSTTNPISWTNSQKSSFDQHKGLLYYDKSVYPESLSIELIDGMVWSTVPKVPKRFFMSFIKNYHAFDINLFWKDISDNAELRTRTWLNQHQEQHGF